MARWKALARGFPTGHLRAPSEVAEFSREWRQSRFRSILVFVWISGLGFKPWPLETLGRANFVIFEVRGFACFCGSKYAPSM